ncbi:MAG: NAD(P)H-dependent oxidoreductase [Bacteriovoracaceae bacterium]|nr:NAD(P)H-dependent oxidoreductase [Bacteriovoracaceae bacterium]
MKILAFAASSSRQSINKKLVTYATKLISNAQVEIIDLNDFELPLYSEDKEKEISRPSAVDLFLSKIAQADFLFISFAEHNGSYTVAYKNLFDWCSRYAKKVYDYKKVFLLSTSPGAAGGKSVLTLAETSMPFFGAQVLATFSLPKFYENFDIETMALKNENFKNELLQKIQSLGLNTSK